MMLPADALTLGELVRRQRLLKGWKQKNLAQRIERSVSTVSKIEQDAQAIPADLIPLLCTELNIDRRRMVGHLMRRQGVGNAGDC